MKPIHPYEIPSYDIAPSIEHSIPHGCNCAHPTHFMAELPAGAPWLERIVGIRANASCRSHAELDESPDLDAGDPAELGRQYRKLREILPRLNVLGGCCGTDHRHLEAICECCLPSGRSAR